MPPTKLCYWAMAYGGHCYWIYAVCDVTIWRHILEVFWHNMHIQRRRINGSAGGAV